MSQGHLVEDLSKLYEISKEHKLLDLIKFPFKF